MREFAKKSNCSSGNPLIVGPVMLDQAREGPHRYGLAKQFGSVVQRFTRRVNAAGSTYRDHRDSDVLGPRCGLALCASPENRLDGATGDIKTAFRGKINPSH